jgi:hypothetical protein
MSRMHDVKEARRMDSTRQFLDKLHDTQAKDERNRRKNSKGQPSGKLPTKQHTNNP